MPKKKGLSFDEKKKRLLDVFYERVFISEYLATIIKWEGC